MATEPALAVLEASAVQDRRLARSTAWFDYWELTKPEINFLIAITAAAGFWMGSPAAPPHFPWMPFLHTLLGTMLVASGAATLNQLLSRGTMRKCGELRGGRSPREELLLRTPCGSEFRCPSLMLYTLPFRRAPLRLCCPHSRSSATCFRIRR